MLDCLVNILSSRGGSGNVEVVCGQLGQLAGGQHVVSVAGHHLWGGRWQCDVAVEGGLVRERRDVHGVRHEAGRRVGDWGRGDAFPSDWRGGYTFCGFIDG